MKRTSAASLMALLAITASALVILVMVLRGTLYASPDHSFSMPLLAWAFLVAGVACAALGVVFLGYTQFLRSSPHASAPAPVAPSEMPRGAARDPSSANRPLADGASDMSRLTDDERQLYDLISERGGTVLQKDLVASGVFSKSKVTRLLDKLERRGLIKRERHGMTNRVRLSDGG